MHTHFICHQYKLVLSQLQVKTNIKNIEYITDTAGFIKKKIKPNFKALGAKVGKDMKVVAEAITAMSQDDIATLEDKGDFLLPTQHLVNLSDVEIIAEDVPGWQVANLGKLTVALDVTITEELKQEGISRELINRIQNLRKSKEFEVTDKINVKLSNHPFISNAVNNNLSYICAEILADAVNPDSQLSDGDTVLIDENEVLISITKL